MKKLMAVLCSMAILSCIVVSPVQMVFNAIVPTGWKTISLKGILDSENGVNSDDDTLTDWKEVMTEKLSWDTDGTVILPTIQECISYATKPYAEEGLSRFKSEQWVSGMPSSDFERYLYYVINNTYILPIYSDPTEEDSDGDNIIDHFDINKLAVDNINEKFVEYINNEYITMDSIHSTDDGFSICLTPLCDILTSMNYPEDGLSPEYYNESSKTGIPAYFDDWYLFNIEDSNSTSYSIIKLREKEAGSYSSVAIPFIAFNMDLLSEYSEGSDTTALQKELKAVTQGQRLQYDKVIIDYFADNSSEALNMIADIYISI